MTGDALSPAESIVVTVEYFHKNILRIMMAKQHTAYYNKITILCLIACSLGVKENFLIVKEKLHVEDGPQLLEKVRRLQPALGQRVGLLLKPSP